MTRTIDRIKALEALLAQPVRVAMADPVPDLSCEQWQEIAIQQQTRLLAEGQASIDRANASAAAKAQAELAAKAPPTPPPKRKSPPVFAPSIFAARY